MSELVTVLESIQKRPGMYFGDAHRSHSIHILQAFITGFHCGREPREDPGREFFTEWVATHYRVIADTRDSFNMILEHVAGDERLAYDEFFRLLPDFVREREKLGRDGILSQFTKVQDELWEVFKKERQ